ncbi:glutathione-dependent formaldehyde-activating, GFA [Cystobacter fuscus DSM 2262]|uniref:Glutathione-dependent formaldehyde-activating, GFA n=1 Tax=Cystobacter fuscus (strain ATCC 25194 / DSM 2262 / NBRC 100088 / M29) TaxID=1242864 RepID=S9R5P9_CYSF2|nr:GFA family protein [Cystobacter fuscus]EPX64303.1 glutathione-dependent formaldehyde-activating, GFA [Cystobacter fuscus DSM 2262]
MTTASSPSTGVRTYRGSCQCGAVRFEADFNPSAGTTRCNCTICTKTAWWGMNVKPESFRLVAGQEVLRDFSRHEAIHAHFCGVCGIRVFGHGNIPELGGAFYGVNLNCLDGAELSGAPVRYLDGLHDTWAELAVAPYVSPFSPAAHARA